MNSEEKIQIGGKQGEERNPDQFLERNDDDGQRHALISLLFSSLPLPLPSTLSVVAQVGDGVLGFRWGAGGYCSAVL